MAVIKKVHVVDLKGKFRVMPAMVELAPGDTLRIVNHTGEDLAWVVSDPSLFSCEVGDIVKRKGAGKLHEGRVVDRKATPGPHDYQVVMLKSGKKARGNSDPMVIIDI